MLQFPASISKVTTLSDGGNKVVIDTPELPPAEMALLFGLKGQVWACFAEAEISAEDLDIKEVRLESSGKTHSERLRSVLFVYWNQHQPTKTFDEFYTSKMTDIIEWIKAKLD